MKMNSRAMTRRLTKTKRRRAIKAERDLNKMAREIEPFIRKTPKKTQQNGVEWTSNLCECYGGISP
jgi:hypothetical protein